ncbi:FAD-dependent monooxygenase [Pontibacterium granulatum]|uniref:flavin-dependent monooxygenase QhpG n=1 Tax=Pontibacterium granulatum TaxID=2036029 RepID=UPI00249B3945|nr:FAD-dependent monooxygenase [Pontibacterium granulatum]MDI3325865.1 FAD-dependent monooxygenase [Pontibacterium granulatum]
MQTPILILGAGPAGGAVALGLIRLGYQVVIIGQPRPFDAVEGISERVVEGLKGAGFKRALQAIREPSARNATWNGASNSANTERLINRRVLDAGIWQDLLEAGVSCIDARISKVQHTEAGVEVTVQYPDEGATQTLQGAFLVEARGRAAPSAGLKRFRGSETVSLLQYWQGPATPAQSAAVSFEDGWAWFAMTEQGKRYLQLTFDVATANLPPKAALGHFCTERLLQIPQAAPFMADAKPVGEPHARTSTPILCEEAVGDRWIRVGDAAMAVDPLSGNGIFQAMSSALQAPAVINTLLKSPQNAELAKQFHQSRVTALFYRFARIGRDFYRMEEQWQNRSFWHTRHHWPDDQPMHVATTFDQFEVKTMPVVQSGEIKAVDVVVTPDQPLGIWHLGGIELAPVVSAVKNRQPGESIQGAIARLKLEPPQERSILSWIRSLGSN